MSFRVIFTMNTVAFLYVWEQVVKSLDSDGWKNGKCNAYQM